MIATPFPILLIIAYVLDAFLLYIVVVCLWNKRYKTSMNPSKSEAVYVRVTGVKQIDITF